MEALEREEVEEFRPIGTAAFTTTRAAGDFRLPADMAAPPSDAESGCAARWVALHETVARAAPGLVSAVQVHGTEFAEHATPWTGIRRLAGFDAQIVRTAGAAAITVADCVPVFIAHPCGTVAVVHAGWRGIASGILPAILARLSSIGLAPGDLRIHLGPAICGRCYEVGPDVFRQLTGWDTVRHRNIDLRALLAEQARDAGVTRISASPSCTRCDHDRFFFAPRGRRGASGCRDRWCRSRARAALTGGRRPPSFGCSARSGESFDVGEGSPHFFVLVRSGETA